MPESEAGLTWSTSAYEPPPGLAMPNLLAMILARETEVSSGLWPAKAVCGLDFILEAPDEDLPSLDLGGPVSRR